jgi:cyclic beta-1,2-glucan synthetase
MSSLQRYLIRRDEQIAVLFAPPFDRTPLDPGYIKGYPPGLRENGGQYSHAAMWAVLAFAQLGDGESAYNLFDLLNPINHARTPPEVDRYKVEPYVIAADVYSVYPHIGRGGWTWYTGSAGWMYQAGVQGILGIRRRGGSLVVEPCLPAAWKGFEATVNLGSAICRIEVRPAGEGEAHKPGAQLDGVRSAGSGRQFYIPLDGNSHHLLILL